MNRRRLLKSIAAASLALFASQPLMAADDAKGFSFQDTAGQHLDVLMDGKVVGRWMYAHDRSTPEKLKETFKPFLHVFDAEGKAPITKGAAGEPFPHHRGIYVGYNGIQAGGKKYDRWHLSGDKGATVHQKFAEQKAGADEATFTAVIKWEGATPDAPAVVEEERTMTFRRGPAPARVTIDLTSKLKAVGGDVTLGGDREHAGVQYRPAAELDKAKSTYVYPGDAISDKDKKVGLDMPWVGLTYTLAGKDYSVVNMIHPGNPKGAEWSAYRDYGRFGAYATAPVKSGEALTLKHRFLIVDGDMPPAEFVQKSYDQFAGAATPSAVPTLTVKGGKDKAVKPATTKPAAKPAAKPAPSNAQ